jgi:hypothetical protein
MPAKKKPAVDQAKKKAKKQAQKAKAAADINTAAATTYSDSKAENEFTGLIDKFEKMLSSSISFAAEKQLKSGMLELFNPILVEGSRGG